jgi:hypothetical protein
MSLSVSQVFRPKNDREFPRRAEHEPINHSLSIAHSVQLYFKLPGSDTWKSAQCCLSVKLCEEILTCTGYLDHLFRKLAL